MNSTDYQLGLTQVRVYFATQHFCHPIDRVIN